jgi:hypothetical protein
VILELRCQKLDRFGESGILGDCTFQHESGFWSNFAMTSLETLDMKNTDNGLSFPLVTHTAYFDTRFCRYGLLKSGYSTGQTGHTGS